MGQEKTTKQVLEEKLAGSERVPLYNPEVLKKLSQEFDQWKNTAVREEDRKNWNVTPHTILGSEVPRGMLYTPLDKPDLDYMQDLGFSANEPYTRGVHANMYRGREFTMRQLTGFGGPEDTNERIKFMLDHGATGVNIIFDLPTIQMYDSDDPISRGQVGMSGATIDSVGDMEALFKDVPIDKVTVSLVTHYPSNTAILFPMYLVMAERRGLSWDKIGGSVQNDITLEEVVRSGAEYIPPGDCFRIQCDNIEFIRGSVPRFNFITYNGYNLREFGTSGVTEIAVAVANAILTLEDLLRRGHDVDWIAERLAFFWSPASDFFEEVARIRAVRRLWYKIMKYRFEAKSARSMWMRCHVQTSGISLQRQEPLNNIVRAAFQALSAIFAGVQSLHVDSYDEAYSVPTEEAALVSLRTQQIIQAETAVTEVVDPLGGSFYVEALTDEFERRILDEVDEIEKMGGYVADIERGWIHRRFAEHFNRELRMIEQGDIKLVGYNIYKSPAELPPIDVFRYPEGVEERQKAKLAKLRAQRDNEKASSALNALGEACKRKENIVPYSVECARAGCSEGELFKVFKQAYGLWRPAGLW
jgi:methylmalonyl-CoA mutase N-terminal domain/subunit